MRRRSWYWLLTCLLVLLAFFAGSRLPRSKQVPSPASVPVPAPGQASRVFSAADPTLIYAHNLMLRKGPSFRVYVRWLRGQMERTRRDVNPSFDDPDSFHLNILAGVLRANVGDINTFLNSGEMGSSPLRNIQISGDGSQVHLKGNLEKGITFPVELVGTLSIASGNRIQIHVDKLNVVKVPFKALLGLFRVSLADLFTSNSLPGITVTDNDIYFDTAQLLPPPHIKGTLTAVRIVNPDLEEIYGNAEGEVGRVEDWRNFLRLRNGTVDFGKLTMHHVDLIMIDISKKYWFDLDLANYQEQLVNGYTRMTPQAGMQVFMPDLSELKSVKHNTNVSIEWMKHRDLPPPMDVVPK